MTQLHILAGNINTSSRLLRQVIVARDEGGEETAILCLQRRGTPLDPDIARILSPARIRLIELSSGKLANCWKVASFVAWCFLLSVHARLKGHRIIWHERTTAPLMALSRICGTFYVYDAHDITHHDLMTDRRDIGNQRFPTVVSFYYKIYLGLERFGAKGAKSIWGVSRSMTKYLERYFESDAVHFVPSTTISEPVPSSLESDQFKGLCYWGKINEKRVSLGLLNSLLKKDLQVTLLGPLSYEDGNDDLKKLAAESENRLHWVDGVSAVELLNAIPRDHVAFFPITASNRNLEMMLPNKFWQAVQLRIPIICYQGSEMGAEVERHGLGVCLEEGIGASDDSEAIKKAFEMIREKFREFTKALDDYALENQHHRADFLKRLV